MKQPGEPASLYIDTVARVAEGDYIRTPTGRTYLVQSVRVQERGAHAGRRQHLKTVVMEPGHPFEDDDTIHDIIWYKR
jgi:hypothetical protein